MRPDRTLPVPSAENLLYHKIEPFHGGLLLGSWSWSLGARFSCAEAAGAGSRHRGRVAGLAPAIGRLPLRKSRSLKLL
jgi:hypothetical protein